MGGDCLTTKPHSSPLPSLARGIEANTRVCHLFYCHGRCVKYSQTADFCVITFSHSSHPSPPGYRLLLAVGDQKEDRMPQSDWHVFKSIIHPPVYSPLRGDVTALYIHQHVKRAPNISSNSTTLLFFHLCNRFSPQSADPLSLCALSFLGKKISTFFTQIHKPHYRVHLLLATLNSWLFSSWGRGGSFSTGADRLPWQQA